MPCMSSLDTSPSCTLLMISSSASRWASCCFSDMGFDEIIFLILFLALSLLVAFSFPFVCFFKEILTKGFSIFTPFVFGKRFLIVLSTTVNDFFAIPALLYHLIGWTHHTTRMNSSQ